MRNLWCTLFIAIIFASCQNNSDRLYFNRLTQLDSLVEKNELSRAADSLKIFDKDKLSHVNLSYFQLLDTRVKDKTYFNFTSDSTICQSEEILTHYKNKYPRLYALSLMYHGIVRYRMGKTDSTVLIPLKKSIDAFKAVKNRETKNLYLCNLYTGLIHDGHNDVDEAYFYLKEAAKYATMSNDNGYLNYTYSELVWNRLKANDIKQAKQYIDTLNLRSSTKEEKIYLLYINSMYLSYNKEYARSIEEGKRYLKFKHENDSNINFKMYYNISQNYEALKDYKNAYYYAQNANLYLTDTCNYSDYLHYEDIGNLAFKANDYKKSMLAYKNAYRRLNASLKKQTDKKVLEIEKKYNYTRIENEKLIAQKNLQIYIFASIFTLLLFLTGILLVNRNRIKEKNERLLLENEKIKLENKEKILQQITFQKAFINSVYALITDNNNEQMNVFYKLRMHNEIKKEKKLCKLIDDLEKDYKSRIKKISTLLLDEQTFLQLTGLNQQQITLLSESDKILYALIKCNLDYNQIATLLGSSYDSIRTRKKNISNKLYKKSPEFTQKIG